MKKNIYNIARPFSGILGKCPRLIISALYFRKYHRRINLKKPLLFHDKIMWMSLHTDTTEWSRLADKYAVREYVKEKVGEGILTKLYGVYHTADEIDFDALPDQFVLKTNNGCTSNLIVRDKSKLDVNEVKKKLDYWLNLPYGELSGQPHYVKISPKLIIAEELLVPTESPSVGLIDYKFNCFDGVPVSCAAYSNRKEGTNKASKMLYDMDWNPHPECYESGTLQELPKPDTFEEMKEIAAKLSRGFPYVRVDLYSINKRPIFGEMTFTPGYTTYTTEYHRVLGDLIKLPNTSQQS